MKQLEDFQTVEKLSTQPDVIFMGVDLSEKDTDKSVITLFKKNDDGSIEILKQSSSKRESYLEKKKEEFRSLYKTNYDELIKEVQKMREDGVQKLQIVKYVWDNSKPHMNLRDSKEFVDTDGKGYQL